MIRSYLLLSFIALVLLQGCRPVTNDTAGGSMDSVSADSTVKSNIDSLRTGAPMNGEVGSSGDFMISAAEAGLTEVKLAELALERSVNPRVKEFAQMMLKDHNATNAELVKLGKDLSVELPSSLCMECEATYDALAKKKKDEFDSVYMQLMVKDHRNVLEKFVFQSTNGSNEQVRKWAAQKIPVLQQHINEALEWDNTAKAN